MADSAGRKPRILLVEDEKMNRLVLSHMIRRIETPPANRLFAAPLETVEVESGEAALEVLQQQQIDLVLMDIELPGMNGRETTKRIRSGGAGGGKTTIPVIAMSAHNSEEDRTACLESGMDAYLTKPLGLPALTETLLNILTRAFTGEGDAPGTAPPADE